MIRKLRRASKRLRVTLWTLIVSPLIWTGHFLFCYLFAAIWCAKTGGAMLDPVRWAIGAATVVALILILVDAYIAWVQMRLPGDEPPHQESTRIDRLRFIAVATLMLAGLSFIAVVYTALPALFFASCR